MTLTRDKLYIVNNCFFSHMKLIKFTTVIAVLAIMSGCQQKIETPAMDVTEFDTSAVLQCIETRTSVRQYQSDRAISRDTVELLLRAAMSAPTAMNKQPWAFVVLDDRATLDSLVRLCHMPACLVCLRLHCDLWRYDQSHRGGRM